MTHSIANTPNMDPHGGHQLGDDDVAYHAKAKFWDKLARKYAARPIGDLKAYEYTLERTKTYLKPDDHMLEIGCGTGTTSLLLSGDVKHITAQDVSSSMLDIAMEKQIEQGITNVSFQQSSVEDLPHHNTYDIVFASSLLHLIDDLDDGLERIHASVEPGGLFISKTVCLKGQGWYFAPLLAIMRFVGYAPYVNMISGDELSARIRGAGFEIIENEDHNRKPSCRFIVAQRPS